MRLLNEHHLTKNAQEEEEDNRKGKKSSQNKKEILRTREIDVAIKNRNPRMKKKDNVISSSRKKD